MDTGTLRKDEKFGLGAAVLLHAALVAVLLMQPAPADPPAVPERMTVSLAEDVGPIAMAPDPVSESRAAFAPTLSENPAPAPAQEVPFVPVQPVPRAAPDPAPRSTPQPAPRPRASTPARPQPRQTSTPRRTTPSPQPSAAPARSGGSRIGADFLPGSGDSTTSSETRIPASQIGASAQASLIQAISRQIKPHWNAPNGVDADQLVTILAFDLNEDGSLRGRPRVVSQSGETASNAPQKSLHAERAIRAVQLAAPFDLPSEYYNAWKSIRGARFDRNLSR